MFIRLWNLSERKGIVECAVERNDGVAASRIAPTDSILENGPRRQMSMTHKKAAGRRSGINRKLAVSRRDAARCDEPEERHERKESCV
jgi:hypothetical protein